MSYRDLDIWKLARERTVEGHRMTIDKLPRFEMYEEGTQTRRSMKSIKSNIVEGYGRRRYKNDYLKFLTYAHTSCDETIDHVETLFETGSLSEEALYQDLHKRLNTLGAKLNRFIQGVERTHRSVKEESAEYEVNP